MTHTPDPTAQRTIGDYLDRLASDAPTPGGGSVAGIVAALATCLGRMVVSLSQPSDALTAANERLQVATSQALAFSEADERAYGGYVLASKLPKSSPGEKAARRQAMQAALRDAAETPLELAELMASLQPLLRTIAEEGNPHVVSDAAVALILADAAIEICLINVRVNIPWLKDEVLVAELNQRITTLAPS